MMPIYEAWDEECKIGVHDMGLTPGTWEADK